MSQDTEQLLALAPWAAFFLAVLVFALIDVRDRLRERGPTTARAARRPSREPLDHAG